MANEKHWWCIQGRHEEITDRVLAAMESDGGLVFRLTRGWPIRNPKPKRLQVYCSEGHLNVIRVEEEAD